MPPWGGDPCGRVKMVNAYTVRSEKRGYCREMAVVEKWLLVDVRQHILLGK